MGNNQGRLGQHKSFCFKDFSGNGEFETGRGGLRALPGLGEELFKAEFWD